MKRVRLTYKGAYHHCMNRGINGLKIFLTDSMKTQFLNYLEKSVKKYKLRIFAYCIMDNHYHLVLENSTDKLSDFFRYLNGQYGKYYRKINSEKGYVFQSRFKSTLIQDDSYLMMSLGYALLNPVRAQIVSDYRQYAWSSGKTYFSDIESSILNVSFVNELFGNENIFINFLRSITTLDLPAHVQEIKFSEILGNPSFIEKVFELFDRRKNEYGIGMQRKDDRFFEPIEKIVWEFEKKINSKIESINIDTWKGKRMRGELLVRLKDLGGLRYSEIGKIPFFETYMLNSMPKLYKDTKQRLSKKNSNKVIK